MNSIKITGIILIGLFFFITVAPLFFDSSAGAEQLYGKDWKKGTVTKVTNSSVMIDRQSYYIRGSAVIKEMNGDVLGTDANMLRGVHEVLYRMQAGKIVEIRILTRTQ